MVASILLAGLAGLLSILSPCVLPLVPIVLGAAASEHRHGPLALASGLALSFTAIGLFVATIGFAIGLDGSVFRMVGALTIGAVGLVLMVPAMQTRLAAAGAPAGTWVEQRFGGFSTDGPFGQFCVGLLLGAVWSPCVGPTLGAASVLAAEGKDLGAVALTMLAFGVGAALPLALLGRLSGERLSALRRRLAATGRGGKMLLGGILVSLAILVATGWDKRIEAELVAFSPAWLTALTTRF
ncbi:cytochrome C biogenesis protein [Prosthecomicrobium hirschii]|uniref:cytochrome c biogenesis CcdA family protein n=1 Tax=Prosthecodimorpha hirschii TaxID=665126 RepID=UPI0011287F4B|nr:cytochrome c biogenesis protein CcdA [Prosthecomicrobium hirschii]TPQ49567.1 cytochrome C biogenesis protein [Prosthecomicrobium hirschii]